MNVKRRRTSADKRISEDYKTQAKEKGIDLAASMITLRSRKKVDTLAAAVAALPPTILAPKKRRRDSVQPLTVEEPAAIARWRGDPNHWLAEIKDDFHSAIRDKSVTEKVWKMLFPVMREIALERSCLVGLVDADNRMWSHMPLLSDLEIECEEYHREPETYDVSDRANNALENVAHARHYARLFGLLRSMLPSFPDGLVHIVAEYESHSLTLAAHNLIFSSPAAHQMATRDRRGHGPQPCRLDCALLDGKVLDRLTFPRKTEIGPCILWSTAYVPLSYDYDYSNSSSHFDIVSINERRSHWNPLIALFAEVTKP